MLGRTAIIAGALFLLLAGAAPTVLAGQDIMLNDQYQMVGKNVIVHLIELNITDYPMGNIYAPDYPNTKWVRLVYTFENFGDKQEKGHIKPIFIDTDGNQYQNFDYTGESVLPHSTAGPFFVEVPVPKKTALVKLIFIEGFEQHEFDIPQVSSSSTPGPSAAPTTTPMPAPGGYSWSECLPLIPFAMAGGVAGVGIVINHCGIRKH